MFSIETKRCDATPLGPGALDGSEKSFSRIEKWPLPVPTVIFKTVGTVLGACKSNGSY